MTQQFYSYYQTANGMWLVSPCGLKFATETKAKEVIDALNQAYLRGQLDKALELRRALGL